MKTSLRCLRLCRKTTIAIALGLFMMVWSIVSALAAPKLKEIPATPELDRVPGFLMAGLQKDWTIKTGPSGKMTCVYLIFPCPEAEAAACQPHHAGDPVVGVGRLGVSGTFVCLWVERLETP